jgi:hypothetical protein
MCGEAIADPVVSVSNHGCYARPVLRQAQDGKGVCGEAIANPVVSSSNHGCHARLVLRQAQDG